MIDQSLIKRIERIEKHLNLPPLEKPVHNWAEVWYGTGHYDHRLECSKCGLEKSDKNEWEPCNDKTTL